MNQRTIAIAAVLMAAALTGIFATSPLAYSEYGCESSVESFAARCAAEETFGTGFMEDNAAEVEAEDAEDEGAFLAFDPVEERANAAENEAEDAEEEAEDAEVEMTD
jgi:hypothetical protein